MKPALLMKKHLALMVLDHFWGIAWGYVTVMFDELYHGDVPIIYRGVDHQKDMMVDLSNPWVQPG